MWLHITAEVTLYRTDYVDPVYMNPNASTKSGAHCTDMTTDDCENKIVSVSCQLLHFGCTANYWYSVISIVYSIILGVRFILLRSINSTRYMVLLLVPSDAIS